MKIIKELYRLLRKSYAATNAMLLIVQTMKPGKPNLKRLL